MCSIPFARLLAEEPFTEPMTGWLLYVRRTQQTACCPTLVYVSLGPWRDNDVMAMAHKEFYEAVWHLTLMAYDWKTDGFTGTTNWRNRWA